MSSSANATEVERNAVDKEKGSGDKSDSLKRPASELNDTGKEEAKPKLRKTTDKAEKENGESEHKDEEGDEEDSNDEVGPEGEGDDFDEEEGDEDGADDDAEEDDEDDA